MNRVICLLLVSAAGVATSAGWASAPPALAAAGATCVPTSSGGSPSITVSRTADLDPAGEAVTVTGTGFDDCKGVYVAFCVVPPAGQAPSPCGGGVDLTGANGASSWISSNPPSYGVGLAVPYGPGGTFTTTVQVARLLSDTVDCAAVQCAVVTRNDHTRSTDRSQDVIVPVFFAAEPAPTAPPTEAPTVPPTEPTPPPTAAPTAPPVTAAATTAVPATTEAATTTAPPVTDATTAAPTTTIAASTSTTSTTTTASTTTTSSTVVLITSVTDPDDGGGGAQGAWIVGGATAVVAIGGAGTFSFLRRRGRL